jgi:hypothetical protein
MKANPLITNTWYRQLSQAPCCLDMPKHGSNQGLNAWLCHPGINVYPRLINIGPQVSVGYPATPPPAKKAAASTPKPAASGK